MDKNKEVAKDEKELEVVETTEETTEEITEETTEETTEEVEESKEATEEEESTEDTEVVETTEEEAEESSKEDEEASEESKEVVDGEEPSETDEETEESEVELTEEELVAKEAIKKFKAKMVKTVVGAAVLIAAIAGGTYVYTGYQTDFTMPVYTGLELEDIEAIEITDEYLESELEWMIQYSNPSVEVERAAEDGDVVNIDYAGSIDGEYFDGGTSEDFDLTIGSGMFVDNFEEQLIGASAGDEVEVSVTFPEDYGNEELNGKEAIFEVTVNAVKEKIPNELNDAYVQAVSEESTTVAEYKEEVRAMLEQQSIDSKEYSLRSEAWMQLMDGIEVTVYPRFTINKLSQEIYDVIEKQAEDYGMTLVDYVASAGYTEETFADYVLEVAQEQYKVKTVVNTIVKNEGLELSDDEMAEKVIEIVELIGFPDIDTAIEAGYTMEDLELNVLVEVIVIWLVDNATLVEPVPAEEGALEFSLEDLGLEDADLAEEVETLEE